MEKTDQFLLALYTVVFSFGVYTNMKISEHDKEIQELRQVNKDTWTV